jgi:hypothetical protein
MYLSRLIAEFTIEDLINGIMSLISEFTYDRPDK